MKTKIFLFGMVLIGFLGFSQTATTTLSLPNLKNEFKIKFDKNVNDDIDVQITDSENSAVIIPLSLKSDDPISKVVAEIYKKIRETTTNYSFKIGKPAGDVVLKITVVPGTASTHTDFLNAIAALPEADFIKLVKPKTLFNNDTPPTTYSNYLLSKIPNSGNEIVVFDGSVTIKFKRDAAGIVNLEDAGTLKISDVQGEAAFYTSFFTTYHMDTTTIGSFMFTTTNFAAVKTIDFNTNVNTNKLEETYKAVAGKSDFDFVNNYDIKNTLTATTASHTVSIKTNLKDHNFILKFCDEAHNCNSTSAIGFSDERSKFIKKVGDWLKTINTNYTMEEADLAELFGKIKTYNETKNSDENTKKTTATLKSIADQLDNAEKRYAGIISIEKRVPVYRNKDWDWNYKAVKDTMFVLKDTANCIVFFNNKIKLIQIEGSLTSNPDKNFVTSNLQYSVPLRAMNTSTHYIPISPNDSDAYGFYININDLLTYSKNVKTTSNSIKNADYSIEPGKPKRVEQRRLMDFFTGILFSDVLGVNSDKPNNLVIAEGRIKMPIWLRNYGYSSFLNFLNADFNVPLYSGLDEKSRLMKPVNDGTSATVSELLINNFDYIRYNNFNAGVSLNLYSLELKGMNLEWSLAYGVRYYRAGLQYTYIQEGQEDIVKKYQLNALTHEISTNLEFRPQSSFGADLNIGYNWLNARGSTDNIPIRFNDEGHNDDKRILRFQANFYMKINPENSNDGIYIRGAGFLHLGADDFYPQFLVGYATNLSSFVSGFKKN